MRVPPVGGTSHESTEAIGTSLVLGLLLRGMGVVI